jgi:ELWxxDGT repeat protein
MPYATSVMLVVLVLTSGAQPVSAGGPARMIRDINRQGEEVSSSPSLLQVRGDLAFFTADDGGGYALWRTDGTFEGTVRLRKLPDPSPQMEWGAVVDGVLFITFNPHSSPPLRYLWRSDGTPEGTGPVIEGPPYEPELATEWRGSTYYYDRDERARRASGGPTGRQTGVSS